MATDFNISLVNICICCHRKFKNKGGFLNIMYSIGDNKLISKTYATCEECSLMINEFFKEIKK